MQLMRSITLMASASLLLALAACGSPDDTAEPAGITSSSTSADTAAETATADGGTDDVLASRLCTALSKEVAALEMSNAGPTEASAQIAIALADVYGDDVAQMDASKIETMTKKTCPEVHDEALMVLKVDSLDALS